MNKNSQNYDYLTAFCNSTEIDYKKFAPSDANGKC